MGRLAQGRTGPQARPALARRRLLVAGLVQGVGFRPYVYRLATSLGLEGWVMNSPGGVAIEVQGLAEAVEAFIRDLGREPPPLARIASVEVTELPPVDGTAAADGIGSAEAAVPAGSPAPAGPAVPTGSVAPDRSTASAGPPAERPRFRIVASLDDGTARTLVSPDISVCRACRREVFDPADRRFGYPFTNCTDCGPRYSIIRGLPYDRPLTSMAVFRMCPACAAEYEAPGDRRFHAQPNACPVCGPRVWIEDSEGRVVVDGAGWTAAGRPAPRPRAPAHPAPVPAWAAAFRRLIREGAIVAVKGLGGFHLACDARSEETVARLRARKHRPAKPFAVMAPDLEVARRYVIAGPEAESRLVSPAAPIVVLPLRAARPGKPAAAPSVAPGSGTLGLMLAYTPLHLQLFDDDLDLLVMTSGNRSDLPIVKDNDAARSELAGVADYFLLHDREIVNRCEDSVIRVADPDVVIPYRRSRGYAPAPVDVGASLPGGGGTDPASGRTDPASGGRDPASGTDPEAGGAAILGAGGEMKSAFCVLRGSQAFLSPHLGEMEFVESLGAYGETYERFVEILGCRPGLVAYDPHPGYRVSRYARDLAGAGVAVFHHHAHLVSCLADNGLPGDEEVLGVICDGTGYGPDGTVWGFELLAATAASFRRLGHLARVRLPGGDAIASRPFWAAAAHLYRVLGPEGPRRLAGLHPGRAAEIEVPVRLLEAAARRGGAAGDLPWGSSCGRLFDAVAALAGVTAENTYEGQAAVELSALLDASASEPDETDPLLRDPPERFRFAVADGVAAAGGGRADGDPLAGDAAGRASLAEDAADAPIILDPGPFLIAVLEELEAGRARAFPSGCLAPPAGSAAPRAESSPPPAGFAAPARRVALLFHQALVRAVTEALVVLGRRTGIARVCLSGGTFQNPHLVRALRRRLEERGFVVFTHRQVPPNDGGLALGQAVAAAWLGPKELT